MKVLESGKVNYWTGEEGRKFEEEYAAFVGSKHAIALTNGTVALELALYAMAIGGGDEVVTTPEVATAGFVYYRFRKPSYTGDERRSMIDRIRQHVAAGRDVFAYFKHEETPEGALYAVELLRDRPRRAGGRRHVRDLRR